jgi:hypothetical protein
MGMAIAKSASGNPRIPRSSIRDVEKGKKKKKKRRVGEYEERTRREGG